MLVARKPGVREEESQGTWPRTSLGVGAGRGHIVDCHIYHKSNRKSLGCFKQDDDESQYVNPKITLLHKLLWKID